MPEPKDITEKDLRTADFVFADFRPWAEKYWNRYVLVPRSQLPQFRTLVRNGPHALESGEVHSLRMLYTHGSDFDTRSLSARFTEVRLRVLQQTVVKSRIRRRGDYVGRPLPLDVVHLHDGEAENHPYEIANAAEHVAQFNDDVKLAYYAAGFSSPFLDYEEHFKFPTPTMFQHGWHVARWSRRYLPRIQLSDTKKIPARKVVDMYASGIHGVSTRTLGMFFHDTVDRHLKSLIQYGKPLQEFVSAFAQHVKSTPANEFRMPFDPEKPGVPEHMTRQRYVWGAQVIDNFTDLLPSDPHDVESVLDELSYSPFCSTLDVICEQIGQSSTLQATAIGQHLMGSVGHTESIAPEALLRSVIAMAPGVQTKESAGRELLLEPLV